MLLSKRLEHENKQFLYGISNSVSVVPWITYERLYPL
jgi:hypothetical protein